MNSKITFPRLASMLADESGRSKRFSEDFLREFFTLISEQLVAGDTVKIKGLGTFRVSRVEPRKSVDVTTGMPMEIAGHSKVVFIPSKEMADAVNSPFEAFPTVEIDDDADLLTLNLEEVSDMLKDSDESESVVEPEETETEKLVSIDDEESTKSDSSINDDITILNEDAIPNEGVTQDEDVVSLVDELPMSEDSAIVEEKETELIESEKEPEQDSEEDSNAKSDLELEDDSEEGDRIENRRRWRRGFFMGMLACFAMIAVVGGIVAFVCRDKISVEIKDVVAENNDTDVKINAISEVSKAEETISQDFETSAIDEDNRVVKEEKRPTTATEEEVPTAPSDAVVYDTIGKTRYLTTMAKAHYGNYNLWPVIYEENSAKLGHPDRIRPGTPVVIPKLSKYGIDPKNKKDVDKIKNMGIAIYARYGKKL